MIRRDPDLILPEWSVSDRVGACFTTRMGGFSRPPFDGLNLGHNCGDDEETVERNRSLLKRTLGLEHQPVWLRQSHGNRVVRLGSSDPDLNLEADASWTDQAGVCCAVLCADCLPILLTDRDGKMVAAVHAGWRGLAEGVIGACVKQLPVPPQSLYAWMGPAIGPKEYEVGTQVFEAFVEIDPYAETLFRAIRKNHWLVDLPGFAQRQLVRLGVNEISGGEYCTASDELRFFSHRRDRQCGRMAALIWIKKASNSAC